MNATKLSTYLFEYNNSELKHKKGITSDYSSISKKNPENSQVNYDFTIPYSNKIILKKNARFDKVPTHSHQHVEINYMYSGSCKQIINGKEMTLSKGELTLIDTNSTHSIGYTDEDDIMINFLIHKDYFNSTFFSRITNNNLITSFFINAINDEDKSLNYLVFDSSNNSRLQMFIHEFIFEYYYPSLNSQDILDNLFILIILEMINSLEESIKYSSFSKRSSKLISAIQYMEENYKTCTLESTAAAVHVNPSYLTTLLKKNFHKSYKELIIQIRMNEAQKLLLNTDKRIDTIAKECGYHNLSFFYTKFRETFHCSPREMRSIYNKEAGEFI